MAKKGNNYYFDTFSKGVSCACDAAALLKTCLEQYDPATIEDRIRELHEIEHAADQVKHDMMHHLVKEFLPPLEREDIMELAHAIDDVTDSLEEILQQVYMYNVQTMREDVPAFADVIFRCCTALQALTAELPNFKKPALLQSGVIELSRIEEEGDRLYAAVVRRLYTEEKDPLAVIAWTGIYEKMEHCCDCCENVADLVEQVIMKNN